MKRLSFWTAAIIGLVVVFLIKELTNTATLRGTLGGKGIHYAQASPGNPRTQPLPDPAPGSRDGTGERRDGAQFRQSGMGLGRTGSC